MLPTLNRLISPKRCSFCKNIVSSSEAAHNQNVCVAVIFVPKIKNQLRKVILWLLPRNFPLVPGGVRYYLTQKSIPNQMEL